MSAKAPAAAKPGAAKPVLAGRCFIDTNILIYSQAGDAARKQRAALDLLRQLHDSASGVISTQVLHEYANVAIKRLRLPVAAVRAQLLFWEQFEVVQLTPAIIHAGLDLHQTRSLGFYDAMIVAAAQTSGCTLLYSEDMHAGETINGVRIVNPFAP